jgi:hypothetical protein
MLAPKLPPQFSKFIQHLSRASPFQSLYQVTYRYLWRHRYQQMHMIWRYMPFHDLDIFRFTDLPEQFAQS